MGSPLGYSTRGCLLERGRAVTERRGAASRAGRVAYGPRFVYAFARRCLWGKGSALICPRCQSDQCRRSKRRGLREHFLGLSGVRQWRCRNCESRFFAWVVPVNYVQYAHFGLCGNVDLQRVASNHVSEGSLAWLGRLLRVPAYRCDPCRQRFFSLRRPSHIRAVHYETAPGQRATPSS